MCKKCLGPESQVALVCHGYGEKGTYETMVCIYGKCMKRGSGGVIWYNSNQFCKRRALFLNQCPPKGALCPNELTVSIYDNSGTGETGGQGDKEAELDSARLHPKAVD